MDSKKELLNSHLQDLGLGMVGLNQAKLEGVLLDEVKDLLETKDDTEGSLASEQGLVQ